MMPSQAPTTRLVRVIHAGRVPYREAWALQRRLVAERSSGRGDDTLLLLEHPPTITLGNRANYANVLVSPAELARRGIALVESDRGGDVTYHAPGQIVGYPILKLSRHGADLGRYVRNLEETIIRTVATYGIAATRAAGLTGVWVAGPLPLVEGVRHNDGPGSGPRAPAPVPAPAKICAIGVKLSASGVTSHGFALNVAPAMAGFAQIVPCGIAGRGVTSLEQLLGSAPPLEEVAARLLAAFAAVFEVELLPASK